MSAPFELSPWSAPFAVIPGLALVFTLGPALEPQIPMPVTGLLAGAFGAVLGLLLYRKVEEQGPMVRIGALTILTLVLGLTGLAIGGEITLL